MPRHPQPLRDTVSVSRDLCAPVSDLTAVNGNGNCILSMLGYNMNMVGIDANASQLCAISRTSSMASDHLAADMAHSVAADAAVMAHSAVYSTQPISLQ